jgi:RsiW-degrading membrane proteinase PrsW (M82 family)
MVRYYAFPKKEFDEPYDGIVYSVMVGMGFATIENIMYVMQHGYATAFVRMFLSVPAHGTFAVLMGYSIGKAWINYDRRIMYMMLGLFWAVFFHGTFDFFLFLREDQLVKQYVSEIMLFSGAVISFAVAVWLSRRAIKEHIILSQQIHGDNQHDNS